VQLQEALNELSEEHNAALAQAQEKQGQLESELRAALQEKVRGGGGCPPCSAAPAAPPLSPSAGLCGLGGAGRTLLRIRAAGTLSLLPRCGGWAAVLAAGRAAPTLVGESLVLGKAGRLQLGAPHSAPRLRPQKCSEEKIEILQGKLSLLEDQLAKLGDGSAQEKGEVMGDVLKVRLGLRRAGDRVGSARRESGGCWGAEPAAVRCRMGVAGLSTQRGAPFGLNLGIPGSRVAAGPPSPP